MEVEAGQRVVEVERKGAEVGRPEVGADRKAASAEQTEAGAGQKAVAACRPEVDPDIEPAASAAHIQAVRYRRGAEADSPSAGSEARASAPVHNRAVRCTTAAEA